MASSVVILCRRYWLMVTRFEFVDVKPASDWYQVHPEAENLSDLGEKRGVPSGVGVDGVFNLAADMGGMGFIENNRAAVHDFGADQHAPVDAPARPGRAILLFVVGVRVRGRQADSADVVPLAKPMPIRRCRRTAMDGRSCSASACAVTSGGFRSADRVARYHNVYGPFGTFEGGREKAPAAICRKVAERTCLGSRRSRFGVMGSRPAVFMISTTASKERGGSWTATSRADQPGLR